MRVKITFARPMVKLGLELVYNGEDSGLEYSNYGRCKTNGLQTVLELLNSQPLARDIDPKNNRFLCQWLVCNSMHLQLQSHFIFPGM